MNRPLHLLRWLPAWLALAAALSAAEGAAEYQVKAAFLFNFAKFVEWPGEPAAGAPFRIGILGDDPFGAAIEEAIRDETIHEHRLEVVRSRRPTDLRDCQVVFVAGGGRDVAAVAAGLGPGPILTVGDSAAFAEQGGAIGFFLAGNKVRFAINPSAARERNLRLSAQLLRLGRIVGAAGGIP